jgi:hypothetical protein
MLKGDTKAGPGRAEKGKVTLYESVVFVEVQRERKTSLSLRKTFIRHKSPTSIRDEVLMRYPVILYHFIVLLRETKLCIK